MCFFPLPLLHPPTDAPETVHSWMGLGSAPAQPLLQLQGNTDPGILRLFFQARIMSNSCPAGHSVPSFRNTGVMMESECQVPHAGSAGTGCGQHWSRSPFPQHCSPQAEAPSCTSSHHFWDTVSTPRS